MVGIMGKVIFLTIYKYCKSSFVKPSRRNTQKWKKPSDDGAKLPISTLVAALTTALGKRCVDNQSLAGSFASIVAGVVEASAPKVYPKVTLGSAISHSESVVKHLRGKKGLPRRSFSLYRAWAYPQLDVDCLQLLFVENTTPCSTGLRLYLRHAKIMSNCQRPFYEAI